jgi:hypothetical protein
MWVIHAKVVASDAFHALQLTVANVSTHEPESWFLCTDLITPDVFVWITFLNISISYTKNGVH